MNKDVIYIEPENDITDIIAKLKQSESKIVALVPPKKAGVLRSAVNTKLIAKTARNLEKAVVFVTADPSLIKLAAASRIPVAKTLQSRPEIPTAEDVERSQEEVIEEDLAEKAEENLPADKKDSKKSDKDSKSAKKEPDETINSEEIEQEAEKGKKKKGKKDKKGKVPSIEKYRKWIIIGSIAAVVLIGFLVWAFVFAPHVDVKVAVRTTTDNFSQNVSFTTKDSEEKIEEGKFLLEEQKITKESKVEFSATGQVDKGNKASGTLDLSYTFRYGDGGGSVSVSSGSKFSHNGLSYVATGGASISWDGTTKEWTNHGCGEVESPRDTCVFSTTVSVSASESGDKYNVDGNSGGWSSSDVGGLSVSNPNAISGGTTHMVTVVQQSDIDKARGQIQADTESDAKDEMKKKLGNNMIAIEPSFKYSAGDPVSSPALGEEASNGKATLTATSTITMFAVDKTHMEQFIKAKSSLGEDQKIYSIDDIYFDRFLESDGGYTAKIKATYKVGPEVTEEVVLEKSKGHKIGEAQSIIKSINGVSSVDIKPSFFWVRSVPSDPNKISVEVKVEE